MTSTEQDEYWAREGEHWVREAARYDAMLGRFGEVMIDAARLQSGERVLDVGCGNGTTTLEAARRVAPGGTVVGVDISALMLALARRRAAGTGTGNVEFLEADAQVHPFEVGTFDAVISQFGTMFFEDPEAAFTNLARTVRPSGRLAIVCWQDVSRQEWIFVPASAAAPYVGLPDLDPPGAPGPAAFADGDRLKRIIEAGGFGAITLEAVTRPMRIGDDLDDTVDFINSLEETRELFAGKPEDKAAAAVEAAREALAPYAGAEGVVTNGTAWLALARR